MQTLTVFEQISADGYFVDAQGDLAWAEQGEGVLDPEFDDFTRKNAEHGGVMVLGRKTYELMASFWPTPAARQAMPALADRMNALPKLVFSTSLQKATWSHTTLLRDDLAGELRRQKEMTGPGLVIMGSGTLVAQLAPLPAMIDEYQFVVIPTVLGAGRSLFRPLEQRLRLSLLASRGFRNGKVWLRYRPVRA